MKNDNLQQLTPVYVHETNFSGDNEITLIDLAKVLVYRKAMITVIFTVTIALGVTIALFTPRTYTYSATIEIGSQIVGSSIQPFEPPQALVAKLQYSYIPQILVEYKQSSTDDKKRFQIKSSVPKGSNIILLEIKGTEDQADTLINLLQSTSQKAIQDHSRIYTSVKSDLEARLIQATNTLKSLKNNSNNETGIAINQNIIETLKSQLTNLQNTREILPPIRSIDPTGGGRKLIVIITALAGLFVAIFAAFFAEFLSKVKIKISEEGKQ